jgi:hypothetical protein
MKKINILVITLFLGAALLVPATVGAKHKSSLFGKVNNKTTEMTYSSDSLDVPSALLIVTPHGNVGADSLACSTGASLTCVFAFGKDGNDSFSKKQKRFVRSGRKFNALLGFQGGELSVPRYDIYRCQAKNKKGTIRCTFKETVT